METVLHPHAQRGLEARLPSGYSANSVSESTAAVLYLVRPKWRGSIFTQGRIAVKRRSNQQRPQLWRWRVPPRDDQVSSNCVQNLSGNSFEQLALTRACSQDTTNGVKHCRNCGRRTERRPDHRFSVACRSITLAGTRYADRQLWKIGSNSHITAPQLIDIAKRSRNFCPPARSARLTEAYLRWSQTPVPLSSRKASLGGVRGLQSR